MRKLFSALFAIACLSLTGCDFREAMFELAPESRLPKWFTPPPGLARSDITATMRTYVTGSGRIAKFELLDARKQKLIEVTGQQKGYEPLKLKTPPPGFPAGYPSYEIVTVNGIIDIVEHRKMEPFFYVTDDPAVWKELFGSPPTQ